MQSVFSFPVISPLILAISSVELEKQAKQNQQLRQEGVVEQERVKLNSQLQVENSSRQFPLLNHQYLKGVCLHGVLLSFPVVITQEFLNTPAGIVIADKIQRIVACRLSDWGSVEAVYRMINYLLLEGTCKGQSIVRAFIECMKKQQKTISQEKILEYVVFFQARTVLQRQAHYVFTQEGKIIAALRRRRDVLKKELENVDLVEKTLLSRPPSPNQLICQTKNLQNVYDVDQLAKSLEKMCILSDGPQKRDLALQAVPVFAQGANSQDQVVLQEQPLKENSSLSKLSLYDFQIQHNQIIQKRKKYLKELKQVKQDILFYHARQQEAFKIRQELVEHAQKIMLECNSGHVGHFALHKKNDHNAFAKSAAGEIAKLMQKNEVEAILLKLFKPFGGGHAILVLPKEKQIFDIQHGTMFYKSVEELMVDLEHYLATSRQYIKVFVHCIGEVSKGAQLIPV